MRLGTLLIFVVGILIFSSVNTSAHVSDFVIPADSYDYIMDEFMFSPPADGVACTTNEGGQLSKFEEYLADKKKSIEDKYGVWDTVDNCEEFFEKDFRDKTIVRIQKNKDATNRLCSVALGYCNGKPERALSEITGNAEDADIEALVKHPFVDVPYCGSGVRVLSFTRLDCKLYFSI